MLGALVGTGFWQGWPQALRMVNPREVHMVAATGLVVDPWLGIMPMTAAGLILLVAATTWLLVKVIRPLAGCGGLHTPGGVHLVAAYAWILASVVTAPLVLLVEDRGAVVAALEQHAPQFLIYVWMLPVSGAVIPYLLARPRTSPSPPALGGSWFSVAAAQAGGVAFAVGLLLPAVRGPWQALA